jgi:hypothetical protein
MNHSRPGKQISYLVNIMMKVESYLIRKLIKLTDLLDPTLQKIVPIMRAAIMVKKILTRL